MRLRAQANERWQKIARQFFAFTAPPANKLLEPAQIVMLREALGQEGWEEAVADFAVNTEDEIGRVRKTAATPVEVSLAAHSLKGVALNMGAHRLALLAAQIEKAAPAQASALAKELEDTLDATITAMRALSTEAG